jgi:hypothetical protein
VADVKALWDSVDHWALSMPTPPNDEGKASETSATSPPNINLNLDLSFFDFIQDGGVPDVSLMGFNDEVERLVSMDDFSF